MAEFLDMPAFYWFKVFFFVYGIQSFIVNTTKIICDVCVYFLDRN